MLQMDFSAAFFNEALRSPNHKTCFSFAQKCLEDLQFHPFSPFLTQPYQNGQANCKSYRHFRAKLKHVLWLEDLKASLRNCTEKLFINRHLICKIIHFVSYFVREFHKCVCQLWFSKVKLICRQIYVLLVGAIFLSAVKHNFI